MSQAQLRIGTRVAGAYRGQRSLGDYNEDQNREEGHQHEARRNLLQLRRRTADEQEVGSMIDAGGLRRRGRIRSAIFTISAMGILAMVGSCRGTQQPSGAPSSAVLRVGVTLTSAANPFMGVRQLSQLLSVEGLARAGEDGRMVPVIAEGWTLGKDGRSLVLKLRPGVTFHDGTLVDADVVARMLPNAMRAYMGSIFSDVEHVTARGADTVEIVFRAGSPFLTEALESALQKPGAIGTGPFVAAAKDTNVLEANRNYYLGPPTLQRIQVETVPTVRTAWAEMLRGGIDMVYEVGSDALPSMQNSNSISVFKFTRRYQYVIILNPDTPVLRSAEVRRALNMAVDRDAVVANALNGYGIASTGPIWPHYWALGPGQPAFQFDPARATTMLAKKLRISVLVPPDAPFERIALEVKRQLAAVGVNMTPEELPINELTQRGEKRQYDAILTEVLSGPTLLRPYLMWHSGTPLNWGQFGNPKVDAALDRVRHADGENSLRSAVTGLQQTFVDDPPAIFLAWSVRARAVNNRFAVHVEEGRDILGTLRLWKPPTAAQLAAGRN
jgi:peptide/nickel transport system substrate-binding protein